MAVRSLVLALAAALTAACGSSDPGRADAPAPEPAPTAASPGPTPSPTPTPWADVHFTACTRRPAAATSTHLRPTHVPRERTTDAYTPQAADVVVEDAGDLLLPTGRVAAGNGWEAATASASRMIDVHDGSVTGHVTVAVYLGPTSGRRVAFVELALPGGAPVTWQRQGGIVTDGGDGGFVAVGAPALEGNDHDIDTYVDAFFPNGNSASGNVCVLRRSEQRVDAVLFSTGFGDGIYPTYVGRDAAGHVVAVVHHSGVVAWSRSGLPGEPPT